MAKKKTKTIPASQPKEEVYFDELLERAAAAAVAQARELKTHQVGAHTYGSDGLFVVALEALTSAQRSRDPNGYITAVAYALAAAVHAVGAWDYPNRPQSEGGKPVNEADYNAGFEDGRKGMKAIKNNEISL